MILREMSLYMHVCEELMYILMRMPSVNDTLGNNPIQIYMRM